MTPDQIKAALEAGILTQDQAKAMMQKAVKRPGSIQGVSGQDSLNQSVIGNEDDMRFLRSFSDLFIAIGLGLLSMGLFASTMFLGGGGTSFLIPAGIMLVLAEFFGRRRRQHLPTLITALFFLWFTQMGVSGLVKNLDWGGDITIAFVTFLAMLGFYWRIRLPFCMALMAISLLYLFFAVLARIAPDLLASNIGWAILLAGLATLAVAINYDIRDQHRTTRFADNAFWLHLTAAPLIIHGLAIEFVSLKSETLFNFLPAVSLDRGDAAIIMMIVGVLAVFGLAINRRALLVSSLGYAGFALGFLMKDTGLDIGSVVALTFVVLGAAVVFLGVGWHQARNALIKILPKWRIFPPPFDENFGK